MHHIKDSLENNQIYIYFISIIIAIILGLSSVEIGQLLESWITLLLAILMFSMFTQIPFTTFISQLTYKCLARGIEVVEQEESYTSKASFVDQDEIPTYGESDKKPAFSGKRVSRGLYRTKNGFFLNADVNGSYNILAKGLLTLGKSLDREKVSFHTRKLKNWRSVANKDLLLQYM